ncbi:hypothetical protein [Rummeliibacillus sp. BSL5]
MVIGIVFLFITQVLSFYFIALLYVKISRLRDIETHQTKVRDELEASLGAYLAEIRDENDRLIAELATKTHQTFENSTSIEKEAQKKEHPLVEESNFNNFKMPRNSVAKAYQKNTKKNTPKATFQDHLAVNMQQPKPLTMEETVKEYYRNGKSVDEIAKLLQKGKTEVELLLKFGQ